MLELTQRLVSGIAEKTLTLPLEMRIRSRLRVTLDVGTDAGLILERGQMLRDGDLIGSLDGVIVEIKAADEPVSSVYCKDPLLLARTCYHLGNRHVPLQIAPGMVRYRHDHVLDDMVRGLGGEPQLEQAPFEPEPGAYGGKGHGHTHSHAQTDRDESFH
jgi:urease accessory protein